MLKRIWLLLFLSACATITPPEDFTYREILAGEFRLALWQKITAPDSVYKVYIEGDGHAFNSRGRPSSDPTPRGTLVRELAFSDNSPNVIYLARPCQYVMNSVCAKRHWTTARFAPEVINVEYAAIKQIVGNNPVVLIGFSGGAQVAGLLAAAKPDLYVRKVITIAGNLDHLAWTQYHHLPPLNESMNLESYARQFAKIPQLHYVGSEDKVIPPQLVQEFVNNHAQVITVEGATHNSGWQDIFLAIHRE